MSRSPTSLEHALRDLREGRFKAWEDVVPRIYPELYALAQAFDRRESGAKTLQPTDLVHEAFLRLEADARRDWRSRAQLCAAAARVMRQILVDRGRARASGKRGGGRERITLHEDRVAGPAAQDADREVDVLALDEALRELAERHPRRSQVIEFRFFGGLNHEETASVLGVSRSTVRDDCRVAKAWLLRRLNPAFGP